MVADLTDFLGEMLGGIEEDFGGFGRLVHGCIIVERVEVNPWLGKMALLNEQLSVWEIGFRWAGHDPARRWWRIPLPVRDNFRALMDAILRAQLECRNISMEKGPSKDFDAPPEFFVRYHLQEIEDCIEGKRFDKRLLRWAEIERWAFRQWCERRGMPLPEFWFPAGWGSDYQWPDDSEESAAGAGGATVQSTSNAESVGPDLGGLRPVQRARIACQQIASVLWKAEPTLTIKAMSEREEIQRLGGGAYWEPEVVQRWLSEADPRDQTKKRGRRKGS